MDLLFVIILGALWGSFANVCIYRLPLNKGVTMGRSYCPKCKKKITWKDNIPIISYFLLSGRCRKCKKPIPKQYVLVLIFLKVRSVVARGFYFFLKKKIKRVFP